MPRYVELGADDLEGLISFFFGEPWPFHAGGMTEASVRAQWADGSYADASSPAFWIIDGDERIGLIRIMDLGDDTPMFDLRVKATHRGRGVGTRAVSWLTEYVFAHNPGANRVEATTRQDNRAMRAVLRHCGYVKEAHYRRAWAAGDGLLDAVGYAILRDDAASGITTPVAWDDESGG